MSSEVMTPVSAWRSLRLGGQEEAGISIPTIPSGVEAQDGKVRHALGPAGEPRILLPVGMHERLPAFKESTALLVADVTYENDGRPIRFIDMMCRVGELESVFSEVAGELLKRIKGGERCRDAVGGTLADFRSLLVAPSNQEISDSEIIGLIGELIVLRSLLEINPDAWQTWRGPAGERHDFRRNFYSLEAKTTARQSDNTVSISSIDQLDAPAGGTLHLKLIVLERAVDAPITVSSMWVQVMKLASQPSKVRELLAQIGCDNPHSSTWNRLAFNLQREAMYQVINGFPRISASSFKGGRVPRGVRSLQYVIDLADAAEFELRKEAVHKFLLRIAG